MARYPRDLQSYVITRLPRVHPHMETTHHHRGSRAWFCINFTSRNTSRLDDDNDLLRHPLRARDAINLYFTGAKGLAASPIILHILEEGRGVTIQRFEIVGMDDDDGRFVPGNGIGENLENKEQGRWNLVRFSRVFWQLLPRVLSGYTRQLAIKCISTLLISSRSHLWGCAHGHGGLRSRARWVCLVSFFTRIGHVAEAHEVRTSLSLSLSSFSASFFHPLIGTLNPNNGHDAEKTDAERGPRTRVHEIHVVAPVASNGGRVPATLQAIIKLITILRSIVRISLDSRRQLREREEGRSAITPSSGRIELSYRAHPPPDYSPISFSPFLCFPVSHHGQLIGVIYKGKPENLGIRNPPGSNKSQVGERDGNGTPLVSWLYCSYYRAMHH